MELNPNQKRGIAAVLGILILIILYTLKNSSYFVRASTFVFSIFLFFLADYYFRLNFKKRHYIIFILISAAGILLSPLYFLSTNYDKTLHLISPFLLGFLVYFLADRAKIKTSTKLLLTFTVVLSSLAMFEIIEYVIDQFFDYKLQGVYVRDISGVSKLNIVMDKNDDTMIDLILGTLGTLAFTFYKFLEIEYIKISKKFKH